MLIRKRLVLAALILPVAVSAKMLQTSTMSGPESAGASVRCSTDIGPVRYTAPLRTGPIELILRRDGSSLVLLDGGAVVRSQDLGCTSEIAIGGPDEHDTTRP
jgi:hypothetical protein